MPEAIDLDADRELLAGKAVVVTGAGRGLGEAFARCAALCGARIVVNDIDAAEAESVAKAIRATGGTAIVSGHSVADAEQARALVESCVEQFGRIDGLINNAGIFHKRTIWEEEAADARRLIEVNLLGAIHCSAAAVPHMRAAGRGSIINLSSVAAFGLAGRGVYAATKAALLSLTYTWALELQSEGVRVNALAPRATTRLTPPAMGEANDVAPVAVFLLSDLSAHVTGQCIRTAELDVAWTLPARLAATTSRSSPGVRGVAQALALAEPGPQPFGWLVLQKG
jgi:NAD(P)-dependent dehydrogenase (short-subunit alcohol dehydrogenase family)